MIPGGAKAGRVYAALGLMGFITVLAQIVFLRKGIANFSGNEIGLALGLFSWLMWVGLGGLLSRHIGIALARPERALYISLLLLSILFPLTLCTLDLIRPMLGVPVGRMVDLSFIALAYFVTLAPFCLVDGADFTFGAAAAGTGMAGPAFAAESVGAAAGGIFFFTAGLRWFGGLDLAWLLLAVTPLVILWAGWDDRVVRVLSLLTLSGALMMSLGAGGWIEEGVSELRWRGFKIQVSRETPLGNINWARRAGEDVLFYDGSVILAHPDRKTVEEAVHPSLMLHGKPDRVLLLTSRATGVLGQVLLHPVEEVHLVMPDPSVLELERALIPETAAALRDPRVSVSAQDPRRFLRTAPTDAYDLIVMDLPDPDTLQFNRFYTASFFSLVRSALAPGGIFSFSAGEPANYVMPEQARYLASLDATLALVFPVRKFYPLGRYVLVAGSETRDGLSGNLADRVSADRGLDLKFMRGAYLQSSLSGDRMAALPEALRLSGNPGINADLKPSAVRHRLKLWGERLGRPETLAFLDTKSVAWGLLTGGAAAVIILLFLLTLRGGGRERGAVLVLLGGFAGVSAETSLLYFYQVNYGFLYSRIALFLGLFMAGTAAGAVIPNFIKDVRIPTGMLWAAYFLMEWGIVLGGVGRVLSEPAGLTIYLALMACAGLLTGVSFTTGSSLMEESGMRTVGGAAYGLDLTGAAVAAVTAGLILPLAVGLLAPVRLALLLSVTVGVGMALYERG